MGDKAHIGFVDAHAEGNRGDDDDALFMQKPALVREPGARGHAGVVGQGRDVVFGEKGGGVLDLAPRQAVNNARLALMRIEKIQQLPPGVGLGDDAIADIGAVERADEAARVL